MTNGLLLWKLKDVVTVEPLNARVFDQRDLLEILGFQNTSHENDCDILHYNKTEMYFFQLTWLVNDDYYAYLASIQIFFIFG